MSKLTEEEATAKVVAQADYMVGRVLDLYNESGIAARAETTAAEAVLLFVTAEGLVALQLQIADLSERLAKFEGDGK